jgi:nucleotide-binding universal stress UspA family protein
MVKRIVVGLDGSEGGARALDWAMDLARDEGAEIIAVYALGPMEDFTRGASNAVAAGLGMSGGPWRNRLRQELERDWCAPLRTSGLTFRAYFKEASASAALMAVADQEDADLIVVGAHDHGGLEDRVLGSVSYKVSHRAHRPVVIIPPGNPGRHHMDPRSPSSPTPNVTLETKRS